MDREKERPRGEGYTTGEQTVCPTGEEGDQGQSHPRTPQDTVPPPRQLLGFAWAWCSGTACHVLRCGYTSPSMSRLKFPSRHRAKVLDSFSGPTSTWSIPLCSTSLLQPLQPTQQRSTQPCNQAWPAWDTTPSVCLSVYT